MKNNPVFTPWWKNIYAPSITQLYHWDCLESTHALAQNWVDGATQSEVCLGGESMALPNTLLSLDTWFFLRSDRQLWGKGQGEKTFFSPSGGLYLTLICQWPILPTPPALAILTAWAVAESLPVPCALKWVNDLYLGSKKIGGILIHRYWQEHTHTCIISIGLNINSFAMETPEKRPISSLYLYTGRTWDISEIYRKIQKNLWRHYTDCIALGGGIASTTLDSIQSSLREYGKKVHIMTHSGEVTGICTGISPAGRMILDFEKEYDVLSLCILE